MSHANLQIRRATMDDLPQLRPLWEAAGLPAADLERRFTEFQVAEADAKIIGALGLQLAAPAARVHSEVFSAAATAAELRPQLWNRVFTVARNHGLSRLWTQEKSPFWAAQKFAPASDAVLGRLPSVLGDATAPWLTLQLKDDSAAALPSLDQEFTLFKQASAEEHAALMRRGKVFKLIAVVIVFIVLALVAGAALIYFVKTAKPAP